MNNVVSDTVESVATAFASWCEQVGVVLYRSRDLPFGKESEAWLVLRGVLHVDRGRVFVLISDDNDNRRTVIRCFWNQHDPASRQFLLCKVEYFVGHRDLRLYDCPNERKQIERHVVDSLVRRVEAEAARIAVGSNAPLIIEGPVFTGVTL